MAPNQNWKKDTGKALLHGSQTVRSCNEQRRGGEMTSGNRRKWHPETARANAKERCERGPCTGHSRYLHGQQHFGILGGQPEQWCHCKCQHERQKKLQEGVVTFEKVKEMKTHQVQENSWKLVSIGQGGGGGARSLPGCLAKATVARPVQKLARPPAIPTLRPSSPTQRTASEFSRLLGFSQIKIYRRFENELDSRNCKHRLKWEHLCLSHTCSFCFPENSARLWRNLSISKMVKGKLMEQSTHFHSLGRDLEFKGTSWRNGSCGERKMNDDDMESRKSRKSVLLEKTNYLHEEQHRDRGTAQHLLGGPVWKFSAVKQMAVKKDALEQKESAFTEVKRMKLIIENSKMAEEGNGEIFLGKNIIQCSPGSAFSFVWPTRAPGEPKSAFSKPVKALVDTTAVAASPLSDPMKGPGKLSGCFSAADLAQYRSLLTSKFLVSDLNNSQLLQTTFLQNNPFFYPSDVWSRQMKEQTQTMPTSMSASPTLTALPPTFTSFGVASQNWCAKCNLSFRMTSDLVLHMRSHHKKEGLSPESQGRRRQEEKLSCPVCQEYFRERHHLSRHMTSHN
ncbi:hypothetical protein JRQ81_017509 [Phrynocephalus forsythii]|uniref:C2H2-type domain-containing protein n=1 Tax=Phrynocephalus forsythii TaxID=171643 RepID=A0A9Q0XTR2_9SAUR|nr:hypothetical protein JRQ81_017509 [Phrynocephalus forsythii]